MYQGMIKSLRNCKGNANCTLPPFRNHFSNVTRTNQTSSNMTTVSSHPSSDFDVVGTRAQVRQVVPSTAPEEPRDLLDVPSNQFDRPSVPQKGRGKGGRGKQKHWVRGRGQKLKAKTRKPRRLRQGPYRKPDPFMDGRGIVGTPGWGGHSAQGLRKLRPEPRRRSRARFNRRS